MKSSGFLIPVLLGTAIAIVSPGDAIALTANEVQQIALGITVLIDGVNPGSGVIIAHEDDTYTVLTARHVVATEDEYLIVTPDGREYAVNYATVRKWPDADLAILEFQSDRTYATATLAAYPYNSQFPYIFVSGWTGSRLLNRPISHNFSTGTLLRRRFALINAQDPLSRGYGLFYTNITDLGMSGGPILDTEGRVIGIHGRSEGEEVYHASTNTHNRLHLGFSAGIPIQIFLDQARQIGLHRWTETTTSPNPLTAGELQSIRSTLTIAPPSGSLSAVDWTNYGNQLYRLERFSEALNAFDQAIQRQPNFHQAWYGRGQVLTTQGHYNDALSAYNQVLQLQPNFSMALRDRALVWIFLDQPEQAVADFDQAVALDPNDYITWYLRGNLFRHHLEWPDAALGAYDRAIAIAPNFAEAWSDRGRVLYQLQQSDAALDSLQRATNLLPDLAMAWHWQSQILYEQQQWSSALQTVEQALEIDPTAIATWILHSQILQSLDQPEAARESLQEALNLDPTHPAVRDQWQRLQSPP